MAQLLKCLVDDIRTGIGRRVPGRTVPEMGRLVSGPDLDGMHRL